MHSRGIAALLMLCFACGRSEVTVEDELLDLFPLLDTPIESPPTTCEPPPDCRKLGWSCNPGNNTCCDALPCTLTSNMWTCGEGVASGSEVGCPSALEPGCTWLETVGCNNYGLIAQACPGQQPPVLLRRCGGSCFAPDELYATFILCSCDHHDPACDSVPCPCDGPSWDAALCCR